MEFFWCNQWRLATFKLHELLLIQTKWHKIHILIINVACFFFFFFLSWKQKESERQSKDTYLNCCLLPWTLNKQLMRFLQLPKTILVIFLESEKRSKIVAIQKLRVRVRLTTSQSLQRFKKYIYICRVIYLVCVDIT